MGHFSGKDILRLKGVVEGKPLVGPRAVNVHVTNACDRACCFCWYFSPLVSWHSRRIDIPYEVLVAFIHDCAGMGVEEINLEGGEITCYPGISDIFKLVPRLGMRLSAYTHLGYGPEHLKYLCLADRLNVNLSAVTAGKYVAVHGGDRFGDVLHNLRSLASIRRRRGKPGVTVTYVIHKLNYEDVGNFLDLAEDLGVDRVNFKLFEATVEMKELLFESVSIPSWRKILAKAAAVRRHVDHNLAQINATVACEGFLKDLRSMAPTEWNNDRLFYNSVVPASKVPCYTGWFYAFVDEKCRVIAPCDNVGVCVAGNIGKRSFKDIWSHSRRLQKIRKDARRGIDISQDRWRECRYCGNTALNQSVDRVLHRANKQET